MTAFGMVFHHFHNDDHPRRQGSISAQDLYSIVDFLGRENILSAEEYQDRASKGSLTENNHCLSFDDILRSQFDVARPVLDDLGISAFWFVYSSPLIGVNERLEVYSYVRNVCFDHVDQFYDEFFRRIAESQWADEVNAARRDFEPRSYMPEYRMHSDYDRLFRWVRDEVLGSERYSNLMEEIVREKVPEDAALRDLLWMDERCLKEMSNEGHIIGLHSHSHPTKMASLDAQAQFGEYGRNKEIVEGVVGQKVRAMSHPCNSYNADTLGVLTRLGLTCGFRSNCDLATDHPLELAREDHANTMIRMKS
jgi:peptidoglycan/xylan/chitin deacetylase (PgdA/CDA1 family)